MKLNALACTSRMDELDPDRRHRMMVRGHSSAVSYLSYKQGEAQRWSSIVIQMTGMCGQSTVIPFCGRM